MSNMNKIRLIWLHFSVAHKTLVEKLILFYMRLADDDVCDLCRGEKANMQHLFWNCKYVKEFWTNL